MKDQEMYALIGNRAAEIAAMPEIQPKLKEIFQKGGKDAVENFVYMAAIATLYGL